MRMPASQGNRATGRGRKCHGRRPGHSGAVTGRIFLPPKVAFLRLRRADPGGTPGIPGESPVGTAPDGSPAETVPLRMTPTDARAFPARFHDPGPAVPPRIPDLCAWRPGGSHPSPIPPCHHIGPGGGSPRWTITEGNAPCRVDYGSVKNRTLSGTSSGFFDESASAVGMIAGYRRDSTCNVRGRSGQDFRGVNLQQFTGPSLQLRWLREHREGVVVRSARNRRLVERQGSEVGEQCGEAVDRKPVRCAPAVRLVCSENQK